MRNKVRQSSEAAAALLRTANSDDEFFLVEFGDRPKLAVPFTSDADAILRRILHNKPFGRTSLLDAIRMSLVEMKHARNMRKAIVILSDGGDNSSHDTPRQIRNALIESDLQVYAIGIFDRNAPYRQPAEERNGPQLLDDLAEQTGGRLYPLKNLDDLVYTSARISRDLRSQYVLGIPFEPNLTRVSQSHLKVISPRGTRSAYLLSARILHRQIDYFLSWRNVGLKTDAGAPLFAYPSIRTRPQRPTPTRYPSATPVLF
jgi:VWFA-related protein